MQYLIEPSEAPRNTGIDRTFLRNNIQFKYYDEWLQTKDGFQLKIPKNSCLFLTYDTLITRMPNLEKWLQTFFDENNKLILIQDSDAIMELHRIYSSQLHKNLLPFKERIILYTEALLERNIKFNLEIFQADKISSLYPSFETVITNSPRNKDFLLTTILRNSRPHRELLINELKSHNLLQYYIGVIHNSAADSLKNWVGMLPDKQYCPDHQISWDLYNKVNFEIVPETFHDFATFVTEKTMKPIIARIPFLVLSNHEFYTQFKKLGFKTFNNLIDESFAYEEDLTVRVKKLVECAEDIIKQGSNSFYSASKEICEHNFNHLLYMTQKAQLDKYDTHLRIHSFIQNS